MILQMPVIEHVKMDEESNEKVVQEVWRRESKKLLVMSNFILGISTVGLSYLVYFSHVFSLYFLFHAINVFFFFFILSEIEYFCVSSNQHNKFEYGLDGNLCWPLPCVIFSSPTLQKVSE